ncbi:hypothetical protein GCM10010844_29950 [Deinococcus radiotolerans]|uniref:Uncharacterized protein n=1 Tax=Deinococcus radiotolerans TaxID=1309407 RepID=A0ABQ2FLA8_9DEIO|nr:hypothetical protein GCM10010844_29950 [Deinococcus radiotolerans]
MQVCQERDAQRGAQARQGARVARHAELEALRDPRPAPQGHGRPAAQQGAQDRAPRDPHACTLHPPPGRCVRRKVQALDYPV